MSLSGLDNLAQDLVSNFQNFTVSNPFPFSQVPSIQRAVTQVNDELWNESPGYSFSVVNSATSGNQSSLTATLAAVGISSVPPGTKVPFAELKFQIAPQGLRQDEEFSLLPRATQTGVIIEHEGFVFKRLTLTGSTGIQPLRGVSGVSSTGQVSLGTGISGYSEFGRLINYIRAYAEFKTDPNNAGARLVFNNYKDNEYWYVEPTGFSKLRQATRPFEYMYEIRLLIIGQYMRQAGTFESLFSSAINFLNNYVIQPLITARQIMQDGVNFLNQVERETQTVLLGPMQQAITTLQAVQAGITDISSLPSSFYTSLKTTVKSLGDALSDLFGYNNSQYDAFYNRTPSVLGPKLTTLNPQSVNLMEAMLNAEVALNYVLATDTLFEQPVTNVNPSVESFFNNTVSIPQPTVVNQTRVLANDTIERIATRYLGTSDRALELITLNNLNPPYIDPSGQSTDPQVLLPGGTILIPLFSTPPTNQPNTINGRQIPLTQGFDAVQIFMGIDFALSPSFDFIVNNVNDFELVAGYGNAAQAIRIKLNLSQGDLMTSY